MNTKLLVICLLISSAVFGQTPPGYTKINARYDWLAGKFDSSLHIPGYATTPNYRTGAWVGAGNVGIDTVNNRLYFYSNGWKYSNASSGGGVPTLQQVLTAGSTGSVPTDIDIINSAGGGEFNELNLHSGPSAILRATANAYATYGSLEVGDGYASLTESSPISSQFSTIGVYFDSIKVKADTGLSLYTNGTQRMVIDASGNVGIGTTPDSTLTISGGLRINNGAAQPGYVWTASNVDGRGTWAAASGGGVSAIGTINGQTKSSNGAVISGTSLYMQGVSATVPGLITTGTDTLAGAKKFEGQIYMSGIGLNRKMNFNAAGTYFIKDDTSGARLQVSANSLILTASGVGGSVTFSDGNVGVTGVINSSGNWSFGNYNDTYKIDASGTIRSTLSAYFATSSGGVAIGATSVNASAILDIVSTAKGFLPPRMTTTQKNAISSPAEGLVVYDLTLHKLCVYTGSAWETITSL